MFRYQPPNCAMAQDFSQPFPKPGSYIFTLLWHRLVANYDFPAHADRVALTLNCNYTTAICIAGKNNGSTHGS